MITPKNDCLFNFGTQLAETARSLKFTILNSSDTRQDLRFIETVTGNRGSQVKAFDSIDAGSPG